MSKWIELMRGVVHPWHHDQFGHMNVRHYAPFFDDATFHMWTELGLPYDEMLPDHGIHTVTARATTTFVRELTAGDQIRISGAVTRIGSKSANFKFQMLHAVTGALHATYDLVEVFFDPETRGSAVIPAEIAEKLGAHLVDAG